MSELRKIHLSGGADVVGLLYLRGIDRLGEVIASDTISFALIPIAQGVDKVPTVWINYNASFDTRDLTVDAGIIRIGWLCGTTGSCHVVSLGTYYCWMKISDNPEVEPFFCGKVEFD